MSRLYMMVTITDRNRKKKFEEFYKKNEHMVFFTTLGRGTANSEMLDYLLSGKLNAAFSVRLKQALQSI